MLTQLRLENFKSFSNQVIPMNQLTILTGKNNSGKSTIIQALRMLNNSTEGDSPSIEGLGAFNELKSQFSTSQEIKISTIHSNVKSELNHSNLIITKNDFNKAQYFPVTCYIGADRLGPRVLLPMPKSTLNKPYIGEHCEFVYDFIEKLSRAIIPLSLHHESTKGNTFELQLQAWLSELSPGISLIIKTDSKRDISHAEFNSFRPTNSGFGLSYTLPILSSILGYSSLPPEKGWDDNWTDEWMKKIKTHKAILLIENPEAHLHPDGQTALGKLIALAASEGLQIILETHSDHVIDGIRIAVKKKIISNDLVNFLFFKKKNNSESPEIEFPKIDNNGKLSHWPEGFFDQTLINRSILAARE